MKKISLWLATASLMLSSSVGAWWGGPGYGNGYNNGFGDGRGNMDMNMSFRGQGSGAGNGWGNGYNGYAPYYGHVPYSPQWGQPPAGAAPADMAEQQRALNEQRMKAMQDAAEAQRKYAEQMFPRPPLPPEMAERMKAAEERYAESVKRMEQARAEMQAQHEEAMKKIEEQRKARAAAQGQPNVPDQEKAKGGQS